MPVLRPRAATELLEGARSSEARDYAVQLGAPALERRAHLAHGGMSLGGAHEPWWSVAEDGLDEGDVSAHLGEPGRPSVRPDRRSRHPGTLGTHDLACGS